MSKYIGSPVVSLSTDTVDVTGDITTTDATPEVIIVNDTHEDTDGGREGKVTFKGQQSGGEETTLAQIQASHDGTSDDEKGDLIFKTNDGSDGASPTERMRIDSSGTLGIGTTSPSDSTSTYKNLQLGLGAIVTGRTDDTPLHLNSNLVYDGSNFDYIANTTASQIILDTNIKFSNAPSGTAGTAATVTERMRIDALGRVGIGVTPFAANGYNLQIGGTSQSFISIHNTTTGNTVNDGFSLGNDASNVYLTNRENTPMIFSTNNSEAMRIDSSGRLLVGTTSVHGGTNGTLYIETNAVSTRNLMVLNNSDTGSSSAGIVAIYRNASFTGGISNTNTSTSFNTSSDYRLKENVTDVTDGITRVKQLAPKRFNFIADADTTVDGFLAHEAQAVVPEAVTGTHDGMRDEEYEVSAATGDIYTPSVDAVVDEEGNEVSAAVDEVIHSSNVEKPETLEEGQQWRETTAAVMETRSVPDYQGIDQAKLVPLLTAALQEAIAKIETLETKVAALEGE